MSDFVKAVDSSDKVLITNGLNLVTGGTGIADLSLPAPSPGHRCVIRVVQRTSGDIDVDAATGTTIDGTNASARFDAVDESLTLVYKDHNEWAIEMNQGSVTIPKV